MGLVASASTLFMTTASVTASFGEPYGSSYQPWSDDGHDWDAGSVTFHNLVNHSEPWWVLFCSHQRHVSQGIKQAVDSELLWPRQQLLPPVIAPRLCWPGRWQWSTRSPSHDPEAQSIPECVASLLQVNLHVVQHST